MTRRLVLALVLGLLSVASEAAAQTYRWVDEKGNVHYAGRRDQVPERYRSQLPDERPGEPPKPRLAPNRPRGIDTRVTGECTLRIRGTERRRGSSHSYPDCETCWKALDKIRGDDRARAECIPSSVQSYR